MKEKKLKLFNGSDWEHRGGHLFIAAHSLADAVRLANEARAKATGISGGISVSYAREYWSKGCWGKTMNDVTPERGVWHCPAIAGGWYSDKPLRLI